MKYMKEKGKLISTVKEKQEQLTTALHGKGLELVGEASLAVKYKKWGLLNLTHVERTIHK